MIVDLSTRHTASETHFDARKHSPTSVVFVDRPIEFPDGPGVFELHVGDVYFQPGDATRRELPASGFRLGPGAAVVVETSEKIRVPRNMAGVVLGKGSLIFKGLIISPGKVDPGFSGVLLIAILNAGHQGYLLKRGAPLCNCMFLHSEADSHISKNNPQPVQPHTLPWHGRLKGWVTRNKGWLALVVSFLSLLVSLAKLGGNNAGGG